MSVAEGVDPRHHTRRAWCPAVNDRYVIETERGIRWRWNMWLFPTTRRHRRVKTAKVRGSVL